MSTQRAFVIQFLQRPGPDDGFTGRAEHVGSGEAVHFTSPDELIGFLLRLKGATAGLTSQPRADAAGPTSQPRADAAGPTSQPRADAAAAGAQAVPPSRRARRPARS